MNVIGITGMQANFINGYYQDFLVTPKGIAVWKSGWRSNLIVRRCNTLLAMLMKRHQGTQGILYCAIGEGEGAWDTNRPIPLLTDTQLTNEVYRKPVAADQIVYLNNDGQPVDIPTTILEVTVEINGEEVVTSGTQPLREFGLFGGDATEAPNTGFMIDHVIHPRIDLSPELTLIRRLRLIFMAGAIQPEELTGFGAALPAASIDGVGDVYAGNLGEQDIQSLSDLVEIDPLLSVGNIPQVKLREFRAKARMVMHLRVTLAPFSALADRSISNLLTERPEDLADAIGLPGVTPEMVTQLQEELAVLQIALDNEQLQRITLGDLMNA